MSFALMTDHFHSIHVVERLYPGALVRDPWWWWFRVKPFVAAKAHIPHSWFRPGSEKFGEKERQTMELSNKIAPSWQPINWGTTHRFLIRNFFSDILPHF